MNLRRFVLKRLALTVPILFGVSVVTFSLVHLTPGGPVDVLVAMNPNVSPTQAAKIRASLGLDRPFWVQYVDWLVGVLHGDFGVVYRNGRDAGSVVANHIPATVALGLFGWVFALVIAVPTGIYAALNKDERGDHVSRFIALAGISIPNFWFGLLLVLFGSLVVGLWPVLAPRTSLLDPSMLWYLVLPGLTIGTAAASSLMRITRTSVAGELHREYVTAARAKGLPERTVVLKHVLRNSLVSVTTVAAFLTASLVSGAVVVEYVFNWPGLGREFVRAIATREIHVIMAITLFSGVAIVLANLLADIWYAILDPRIRHE